MTAGPRRRWATLTAAQLAIAEDLRVRAERLMAGNPHLTRADAVDAAAIQAGHVPHLFEQDPDQEPEDQP